MKYPAILFALLLALPALTACGDDPEASTNDAAPAADAPADSTGGHGALSGMGAVIASPPIGAPAAVAAAGSLRTGEVKETMTTAGYTYVRLDTDSGETWAAGPAVPLTVGQRVEMPRGQPMANFHSSTLERDFEKVWFVDWIRPEGSAPALSTGPGGTSADPHGGAAVGSPHGDGDADALHGGGQPTAPASMEPLEGGVTVEAVFGMKAGEPVALRGRLVKLNRAILGFDWLHIMDGTGDAGSKTNDLVVTAASGVQANVGDTVVIRGVVATDKDFGAGYTYALLVEEATVTVE